MARMEPVTRIGIIAVLSTAVACIVGLHAQTVSPGRSTSPPLEMRVTFEPTAFPSANHTYLFYELHIRNAGSAPAALRRIEVLDAAQATREPLAAVEAEQLDEILQPFGAQIVTDASNDHRELMAGGSVVAFMSIALDRGTPVPDKLLHRVVAADFNVEGAVIDTHHTELHVLRPPVEGANWGAFDGPSNDSDNHHRRGILIMGARPVISRRYAIDWKQVESGATFAGDARDKNAYFAYGKTVLAVADGRVITARDGLPDNVPAHNDAFHPAVPITMETVAGNTITLDIGGRQFVYYCHLQPGSVRVKVGDRVRRGQLLARVGNSGDAREPHLHIEVTTDPRFAAGEGVPYLIDNYRVMAGDNGITGPRTRELPLNGMLVDFGSRAK